MIVDCTSQLANLNWHPLDPSSDFDGVLMADPGCFDVKYAINPFMKNADGKLQKVNPDLARDQWEHLKSTFSRLGLKVSVMKAVQGLPDLVFTANQSFPFWNSKTNRYEVILSKMRASERQGEVQYFERFWRGLGCPVHYLESSFSFEGNGDAIYSPLHGLVFGGFGPRTDKEVYVELSERFGLKIVRLELVTKDFYHLDTCFSILSKEVAAVQLEAFSENSRELLRSFFPRLIEITYDENKAFFCGNGFCPDEKTVILQRGAPNFCKALKQAGFETLEVETSEFMKSGGSVFCLKLYFPSKLSAVASQD